MRKAIAACCLILAGCAGPETITREMLTDLHTPEMELAICKAQLPR